MAKQILTHTSGGTQVTDTTDSSEVTFTIL